MTPNLSAIAETIRRRMFELDIRTFRKLEDLAGVKRDTIRHLMSGRTKTIRADKLEPIAQALKMDVSDLIGAQSQRSDAAMAANDLPPDYLLVPRYDIHVSAGSGAFPNNEAVIDHVPFRRDFLSRIITNGMEKLAVVEAVGDSMEPAIKSGDKLLINLNDTKLVDGGVFALLMNDTLVVKRTFQILSGVEIRSDNPAHRSFTVENRDLGDLRIIGRVAVRVGVMS